MNPDPVKWLEDATARAIYKTPIQYIAGIEGGAGPGEMIRQTSSGSRLAPPRRSFFAWRAAGGLGQPWTPPKARKCSLPHAINALGIVSRHRGSWRPDKKRGRTRRLHATSIPPSCHRTKTAIPVLPAPQVVVLLRRRQGPLRVPRPTRPSHEQSRRYMSRALAVPSDAEVRLLQIEAEPALAAAIVMMGQEGACGSEPARSFDHGHPVELHNEGKGAEKSPRRPGRR
jgi:hypothetical protein